MRARKRALLFVVFLVYSWPLMKIAMVTGGGSGLGRIGSLALARAGWTLVLVGRREGALAETLELTGSDRGDSVAIPADVSDPAQVDGVFQRIESAFGRLDFLFNNAGALAPLAPIDEVDLEDWRRLVDVNLNGAFYCLRGAFGLMKRQTPQGGRIINNGSISAQAPRPHAVAYNATKTAITGLTRSGALEGRRFHIAVGQIDIGNARTEMTSGVSQGALQADGSLLAETTMSAENVAKTLVYLAELPLEANAMALTLISNEMPFVGRG